MPAALSRSLSRLIPLILALNLIACGAPAKNYYLLRAAGPAPAGGGVGIGVGPVELAGHLDRPNLVVEESDHRLGVAESHRWAGTLAGNIAQVTTTNLGRLLHTGNIRTYPWSGDTGLKYQISLDIHHFEATAEGDALLEATWRLYAMPDSRLIATRSWSHREPLRRDGYEELVGVESRLLEMLAKEIAADMGGRG